MSGQPKMILMVSNFFSAAGQSPQYCYYLADKFEESGIRILRTSFIKQKIIRLIDIAVFIVLNHKKYTVGIVDVFSGAAFFWALLSVCVLRLLKKKVVLVLHGGNLPEWAKGNAQFLKWMFKDAVKIVSPSRYLAERLSDYCPHNKKIDIIPNAIDATNAPEQARVTSKRIKLCWLRAYQDLYRPEMAIEVFADILATHPDVTLDMYGIVTDQDCFNACKELIRKKELEAHVNLYGAVKKQEVLPLLYGYDLFLNTSSIDNTPVSIIEAMTAGLPIVSTDAGGLKYLLRDGVDALLVSVDNSQRMAESVIKILDDQNLANTLAQNARANAGSFEWSKIYPYWEKLLSSTIELA